MTLATATVLLVRFIVGLGLLAVGPMVVWDLVTSNGLVEVSSHQVDLEIGMFGLVVAAAAVAAYACWQPVAVPWRPWRAKPALAVYVPFAVLWVGFLVAYLSTARALGFAIPPQPFLAYAATADVARPGFWLVVFGITVAAPVAEEIVFRGYLQGALATKLPRAATIVIVGFVFGLVHTLPYALPVGVLGALFSWLVFRHGSLLPGVVAHAVHNSLIVAITVCWPGSVDLLYSR